MRIIRSIHPSPAFAVACIALAVALGGTGYAALVLPAGSVGTKQLKNGAVIGAKVKAGSLRAANFGPGQLPKGPQGDRGADGLPGAAGPQGPKGDPATKLFAVVDGATGKPSAKSAGVDSSKTGANTYTVSFPQSVSGCAPIVSVSFTNAGDGGQATAAVPAPGANVVNVATFDSAGDQSSEGFAIAVFC